MPTWALERERPELLELANWRLGIPTWALERELREPRELRELVTWRLGIPTWDPIRGALTNMGARPPLESTIAGM